MVSTHVGVDISKKIGLCRHNSTVITREDFEKVDNMNDLLCSVIQLHVAEAYSLDTLGAIHGEPEYRGTFASKVGRGGHKKMVKDYYKSIWGATTIAEDEITEARQQLYACLGRSMSLTREEADRADRTLYEDR